MRDSFVVVFSPSLFSFSSKSRTSPNFGFVVQIAGGSSLYCKLLYTHGNDWTFVHVIYLFPLLLRLFHWQLVAFSAVVFF